VRLECVKEKDRDVRGGGREIRVLMGEVRDAIGERVEVGDDGIVNCDIVICVASWRVWKGWGEGYNW
jgi:hypothetical protein